MKKVKTIIKLELEAGRAQPGPPVGPSLAQHGIKASEFCQRFNDASKEQVGWKIPTEVRVYEDGTYDFALKQPAAAELLKKTAGVEKGSAESNRSKAASITDEQLRAIAQRKMPDLNTKEIEKAMKIIRGTAKSLGIEVK